MTTGSFAGGGGLRSELALTRGGSLIVVVVVEKRSAVHIGYSR